MGPAHENQDALLLTPTGEHWRRIGIHHHHGISVPLFSLHTRHSCGIGEFLDLIPLIDWCSSLGMDIIQLLPLNDTLHYNNPYEAISAHALNPLHLSLHRLPYLESSPQLAQHITRMQALSATPRIRYDEIRRQRHLFLKKYLAYASVHFSKDPLFYNFVEKSPWLINYALFLFLKEKHGNIPWEEWPQHLRRPTEDTVLTLLEKYRKKINIHLFTQYLCFQQMYEVKRYATEKSVFIKGDMPLLVHRDSADVWSHQHLFNMTLSAGTPPDMFCSQGQNWGSPTYNWNAMQQEQYQWWKERLATLTTCYHLYRLDHVIGFFRLWSIPKGYPARKGYYLPKASAAWLDQGTHILNMMIKSCPLLPIGEDLGTTTPEIRQRLRELGICCMRIPLWDTKTKKYPRESLTTVSTHDTEPVALWWRRHTKESKALAKAKGWSYHPTITPEQHHELLRDSHNTPSLFHINPLQEYLRLLPEMSWPDPEDDLVNIPGTISKNNWTFRFRIPLEEMTAHHALKKIMRSHLNVNKDFNNKFGAQSGF